MSTVVLLGAASGIGEALGRALAAEGHDLVLAGRDAEGLASQARDLDELGCLARRGRERQASDPLRIVGLVPTEKGDGRAAVTTRGPHVIQ